MDMNTREWVLRLIQAMVLVRCRTFHLQLPGCYVYLIAR